MKIWFDSNRDWSENVKNATFYLQIMPLWLYPLLTTKAHVKKLGIITLYLYTKKMAWMLCVTEWSHVTDDSLVDVNELTSVHDPGQDLTCSSNQGLYCCPGQHECEYKWFSEKRHHWLSSQCSNVAILAHQHVSFY